MYIVLLANEVKVLTDIKKYCVCTVGYDLYPPDDIQFLHFSWLTWKQQNLNIINSFVFVCDSTHPNYNVCQRSLQSHSVDSKTAGEYYFVPVIK